MNNYHVILDFWFNEISPKKWWEKDPEFDEVIRKRFGRLHQDAAMGNLAQWRNNSKGRLAEIIILDQFSRNIYRDNYQAFMYDGLALLLSQIAVQLNADHDLTPIERSFLYMPMMHSEDINVHNEAIELYARNEINENFEFELKHKAIIERFGRYPHRNVILGRESTDEEIAFLNEHGVGF